MAKSTTRTMTRTTQGRARRRPQRGSSGQELPRSAAAEPTPAGPAPHPGFDHKRLAAIDAAYAESSALQQLQLVQERMDLQKELEAMGTKVDLSALEGDFVKTAAKYAAAQGHLLRRVARARGAGRRAEEGGDLARFLTDAASDAAPSPRPPATTRAAPRRRRCRAARRWRARGAASARRRCRPRC